jgi:hypothetical protein
LLGEKELTEVLPMTAKRATTLVQAGEIFMVLPLAFVLFQNVCDEL